METDLITPSQVMNTYQRLPISFSRGEGAWLFDLQGNRFLDALCGISVTNLGHCHPTITAAIQQQAEQLLHTSNLYHIPAQQQLASRLCEITGMDNVFFSNSGAEANEAAIKLARLHAANNGNQEPFIITMTGSFHGRTLATLTATGNAKVKQGFGPLPAGFLLAEYNDIASVTAFFSQYGHKIAAVIIEVVQGEGGINLASADYLQQLQTLCENYSALLIADEVQCGNGRCGEYFAYQRFGLTPDVVTTAKGLGNGVPIGACLARDSAAQTLSPGTHGSTFGGNPLASVAALAVIDVIEKKQLAQRAADLGQAMLDGFAFQLKGQQAVKDIRGCGLMIGIELDRNCAVLVTEALAKGLLINVTNGNTIRLLPPLIMRDAEADLIVDTVSDLIVQFIKSA